MRALTHSFAGRPPRVPWKRWTLAGGRSIRGSFCGWPPGSPPTSSARALARRGRPVPAAKPAWFAVCVALLLAALVSPVDRLGEERVFYLHMAQHLLLGDLAPLALVLSLDGRILRSLLALKPVRALRGLAHPLVAFPLWAASLCLWHLSVFYQAALSHSGLHALEHLCFFAAGALMWTAVFEPLPGPAWFGPGAKAVYVLAVRTVGAIVASVFVWSQTILYTHYAAGERAWGIAPHTDQAIGGLLMFVEGSTITVIVFAWLFLEWARKSELRQSLLDSGHDPVAATRAARYERSALARTERTPSSSG